MGSLDYTAPQGSTTIQIQGAQSTGTNEIAADIAIIRDFKIEVYRYPSAAQTLLGPNQPLLPVVTSINSGSSATYTTPAGASYLHVRMTGPGGGGAGSGTGGSVTGGTPTNDTTFGLHTAGKGSGGAAGSPGAGGTCTIGAGATGTPMPGADGSGGQENVTVNSTTTMGGPGGVSFWGGGGAGGNGGAIGGAAKTNSGSGGGGAGTGVTAASFTGTGGGAGCTLDLIIPNPAATYTYTIGTGGSQGGAGTGASAFHGGAGADGYIEITPYYGASNAPVLIGGVVSPQNTTGSTVVNNTVAKSGNYTATTNDESIIFSAAATLTLPAAASVSGKKFHVVANGSASYVTLSPASGNVCGVGSIQLAGGGESVDVQSDGANYQGLNGSCYVTRNVQITCSGSSTLNFQFPGTWATSISNISSNICNVTMHSGIWSTAPICTATDVGAAVILHYFNTITTTTIPAGSVTTGGGSSNASADIVCMGPR